MATTLIVQAAMSALAITAVSNVAIGLSCDPDPDSQAVEHLASGANDVVVVRQADGTLAATPLQVHIGKLTSWRTLVMSRTGHAAVVAVNGVQNDVTMTVSDSGAVCFERDPYRYTFTDAELQSFGLRRGANPAVYRVSALKVEIRFMVFLMDPKERLVVTDIDGTITKSDVRGHVVPYLGVNYDHSDVVELFDKVAQNGYQLVYITARPMGYDEETRDYLFKKLQNVDNGFSLPPGPLFLNPRVATKALVEATTNPNVQKTRTLKALLALFPDGGGAVHAAYGNTETDTKAYVDSGIDVAKIFIVNEEGVLTNEADGTKSSYTIHANEVNQLFPSIK